MVRAGRVRPSSGGNIAHEALGLFWIQALRMESASVSRLVSAGRNAGLAALKVSTLIGLRSGLGLFDFDIGFLKLFLVWMRFDQLTGNAVSMLISGEHFTVSALLPR